MARSTLRGLREQKPKQVVLSEPTIHEISPVDHPRANSPNIATQLLNELKTRPVVIDEVQRKVDLAIALIEGVDYVWHLASNKPEQPPTLLFAGTPALGDDVYRITSLGKFGRSLFLVSLLAKFELRFAYSRECQRQQ